MTARDGFRRVVDVACRRRVLLGVYVILAVLVTVQKLALGTFDFAGRAYPPLQNYAIFRNAFPHLVAGHDLYRAFPSEQWDLFKYTPTFALAMAPIAVLPYSVGAILWNLVNALALFGAVMWLPRIGGRARAAVLWFVLLNLVSSLQNAQSNGLMAGLMLAGLAGRERGQNAAAALCVVAAAFVKPFGGLALLPCLVQPGRVRFLVFAGAWALAFVLAPLLVVSPEHLASLYRSWLHLLQADQSVKVGVSVMSWLRAWFGLDVSPLIVVVCGGVLLVLPMARPATFRAATARVLLMASVLIWVVIFNHMAEPPTYVIAMLGVALWYFCQAPTRLNTTLIVATFLLTGMAATDIYPKSIRRDLISPFVLRAAPCILVWMVLQHELLRPRPAHEARS